MLFILEFAGNEELNS